MKIKFLKWIIEIKEKEKPVVYKWEYGCKHGLPNFIHCPECDN